MQWWTTFAVVSATTPLVSRPGGSRPDRIHVLHRSHLHTSTACRILHSKSNSKYRGGIEFISCKFNPASSMHHLWFISCISYVAVKKARSERFNIPPYALFRG